ncbi:lysophospholipase [Candidatus Parcubacteria bacterium]|nr:lysophospholipase [Patescibacteria group bacterium]MCG2688092.1 lysophospholipase [Candidatus Parcubacteria bacterium]
MEKSLRIKNELGEELDVLVEGNLDGKAVVVLVHGWGTDKNETADLFVDISKSLQEDFIIVRFDFSGYGQSQGKQEEASITKYTGDLRRILKWVENEFRKPIYIYAHSMGTMVTSLLSPDNIEKVILGVASNNSPGHYIERIKKRIESKGGTFDLDGISIYPRTSGQIQKIGSVFWQSLKQLKPLEIVAKLAGKTNLLMIRAKQDEIIDNQFLDEYKQISNLRYLELDGSHSFVGPADRKIFIKEIKNFFLN